MMSKKDKTSPNEYRTGGPIHHSASGALFAVGIFVALTFFGMVLTAGLLILRINPASQHKVIAALHIPEEAQGSSNEPHMDGLSMVCEEFGVFGQTISEFCEKYYELPTGIYIIRVVHNSPAALQGVLPGDILVKANGKALRSPDELQEIIDTCPVGELVTLNVNRKGKIFTVYFTPGV